MKQQVVIGLGFGDEGKGLVTDWLCSQAQNANKTPAVIRFSGGHQVGHNVVLPSGKSHIFSNFGSGTLRGVPTFWMAKTIDPIAIVNETIVLDEKGVQPVRLYAHPHTPITTFMEKERNQYVEQSRGDKSHGSVGVGFGKTIEREKNNYHLYLQDIFYPEIFERKLGAIRDYYSSRLGHHLWQERSTREGHLRDALEILPRVITPTWSIPPSETLIYEGSQGLLLDMDYGVFPHVTYSRLGTQEIEVTPETEYYLVTRAYQTRHGRGFMSSFSYEPHNPEETNIHNDWQGEFRTAVLDLDMLNYSLSIDRNIDQSTNKNIVITCLDQMTEWSVVYKGKKILLRSEEEWLHFVVDRLPEANIYVSHGPTAENITRWK